MIVIKEKKDCCGCSACASVCPHDAIEMKVDDEGFVYPDVDVHSCVDCKACEKVCPLRANYVPVQTDYPKVFAAVNKDETEYNASSSGGMFMLIAREIMKHGGVAFGSRYDADFRVVHSLAEDMVGCARFQGSKYTQSDTIGVYPKVRQFLKEGRKVLFTGTPCQVAGLRLYLKKEYENLFCCDLICHGVPSPSIYADYLNFVSQNKKIARINFKYKIKGKDRTTLRIDYSDGTSIQDCLKTRVWNELQFSGCIERPSCYDCKFTNFHRPGDISLGDFWGLNKLHSNFCKGKCPSLVILNTNKGLEMWQRVDEQVLSMESNMTECLQPQLIHPTVMADNRVQFWQDYLDYGFSYIACHYAHYNWPNRIKELVKQISPKSLYVL